MPRFSPPRSAYLHVPFCARRCGYCNFAVVAGRGDLSRDFLAAIRLELERLETPRPVDTLYFGGGTPTQLPLDELLELCELARQWFPLADGHEWTVEANPNDASPELTQALSEQGVTRVSLGAQSLHAKKLLALERDHTPDDVARAVQACRRNNVAVALDLIFAAPDETLEGWNEDLAAGLGLRPSHVSTYGLTFEKGTAFWSRRRRGDLGESPDELQRLMYLSGIQTLGANGFEHYEVSNFALPGQRSRHNEAYWSGAGYFAAGPGAARYVDGVRETNHRSTSTYLRRVLNGQSPVAERERLSSEERARERLVFGLRRVEGVEKGRFAEQTGYEVDSLAGEAITRYSDLGMLDDSPQRVALTQEGLLVSDSLWPELL